MMTRKILTVLLAASLTLLGVAAVYLLDHYVMTLMAFILVFLTVLVKTLFAKVSIHTKILYFIMYAALLVFQILFISLIVYALPNIPLWMKPATALSLVIPFLLEQLLRSGYGRRNMMPTFHDFACVSYAQLKHDQERILATLQTVQDTSAALSLENLTEIAHDLPRHSSNRYINNGSLTESYFDEAYRHLNDGYVYLVLTNSGTAANSIISAFTRRDFNHISISLDRDLRTIISYNGGGKVSPPGLNHEMLEFLTKNEGACVMVYRLAAKPQQKRSIIKKLKEINTEGSAYNLLGLVFKYSRKPNILFCSQFVYTMLEYAGLSYFRKKRSADVRPSDFVELDYYRKLAYECEIRLS